MNGYAELVNPFLFLPRTTAGNAALANPVAPAAGAAAFSGRDNFEELLRRGIDAEIDPVLLSEARAALQRIDGQRFELDEDLFMLGVEPCPLFLMRDGRAAEIEALLELARAEEWPAPPRRRVA